MLKIKEDTGSLQQLLYKARQEAYDKQDKISSKMTEATSRHAKACEKLRLGMFKDSREKTKIIEVVKEAGKEVEKTFLRAKKAIARSEKADLEFTKSLSEIDRVFIEEERVFQKQDILYKDRGNNHEKIIPGMTVHITSYSAEEFAVISTELQIVRHNSSLRIKKKLRENQEKTREKVEDARAKDKEARAKLKEARKKVKESRKKVKQVQIVAEESLLKAKQYAKTAEEELAKVLAEANTN
jgi:hypothetical protein